MAKKESPIRMLTIEEISRIKHGKVWKAVLAKYRPMWAEQYAKNPAQELTEEVVLGDAKDWFEYVLSRKTYNRQDETAELFGIDWKYASSVSLLRLHADVLKSAFAYFKKDMVKAAKLRAA